MRVLCVPPSEASPVGSEDLAHHLSWRMFVHDFIVGVLASTFFPRLNFSSETRILLLYPTVPRPDFQVHITRQHINILSHAIINFARCVAKSVLVMLDIFLNRLTFTLPEKTINIYAK